MESDSRLFIVGAGVLVLLMAFRGWRLGLVRQALSMVSIALAYGVGFVFGGYLIPILRPLGFPDRILTILGAVIIGMFVYLSLALLVAVLFKRTSQQSVGVVKLGFGAAGALLGAIFGVLIVFVCVIAVRLAGSIVEADAAPVRGAPPTSQVAARIAAVKHSIEQGPTGPIIEKIDPVPTAVYDTLSKVGRLAASPAGIERFATDNDVKRVSAHPKIIALRDDPEVQSAIRDGDYLALLRHPKLVEAANDPELMKLLGTFDLQKALDRAVPSPQKPPAR